MDAGVIWQLSALAAAGLAAGFIGGLFGVGGGLVLVPALSALFAALGVDEAVRTHAAVATSASTIIATSARSLRAHARAGAVDWALLKAWAPWIAFGAVAGALLAGGLAGAALAAVFGLVAMGLAAHMTFGDPNTRRFKDLPRGAGLAGTASGIGAISAIMGVGGGALGVTVLTLCGRPIHQAVATASGFGAAIALPATLGYIIAGWGRAGLPVGSLGYVHAPGFVLLALLTATTAPYGARLAHRWPQLRLRRAFAVFLAVMGAAMLADGITG